MEKNFKQKKQPITLPPELKSFYQYEVIKTAVKEELFEKIPTLKENFRMDTALTLVVCVYLEGKIENNQEIKIDKKSLAVLLLSDFFELNEEDAKLVGKQIDFLHQSGLIVKDSHSKIKSCINRLKACFCIKK